MSQPAPSQTTAIGLPSQYMLEDSMFNELPQDTGVAVLRIQEWLLYGQSVSTFHPAAR